MFIRWQSRKRRSSEYGSGPDVRWQAVLVEAKRVDGRPVQKHIAVITTFTESALPIIFQRCHIWDDVTDRLDRLGNRLTADDRERIEQTIAAKAGPRPSPEDYLECARYRGKSYGWEYLSAKKKARLGDEEEQWRDRPGDAVESIRSALRGPRTCSFCGKTEHQAKVLIQGYDAYICDECVGTGSAIVAERTKAG
jgi:hypothetical protein